MPQGTGIVVGRFQIDQLHKGHEAVIKQALDECEVVIVFIGCLTLGATARNPLNYEARRQMIRARFSYVEPDRLYVIRLDDTTGGDKLWLDTILNGVERRVGTLNNLRGYGSRDSSFLCVLNDKDINQGRVTVKVVPEVAYVSATVVREEICKNTPYYSTDMRRGIIHAKGNGYPAVYPVIDCLIYNPHSKSFLLGRRNHEDKYRIIGGFFEAKDTDLITCVQREVHEETGLGIYKDDIHYIGSVIVDDPRLRGEAEKILTNLHVGVLSNSVQTAKGADDIFEVKWFNESVEELAKLVVPAHAALLGRFKTQIEKITKG